MTRIRWRAIARALGVPLCVLRKEARLSRIAHKRHGNMMAKWRWTVPMLRDWAEEWTP